MSEASDEWAESAAGWDDDPYARAYAAAAFDSLLETGVDLAGARVLDFGAGTGLLTERLAPIVESVVGVDTSRAMLELLDRKSRARGWENVTTASQLDERHRGFDLVVASSVCAFVDDYPRTAVDLVDRLVPRGWFVQWDWEREEDAEGHGLSRTQIAEALRAAELVDVAVRQGFEARLEDMVMAPLMGIGRRPQS
ncbi:MAG: class I SAM-dependent methyltransferase [Ilumatobacter sp.]